MSTGALKNFPVVQVNTKRWLNANQKYGRRSRATSRAIGPRRNIKASRADQFCDPALTKTRLNDRCRSQTLISGHKQPLSVLCAGGMKFPLLFIRPVARELAPLQLALKLIRQNETILQAL